MKRTGLLVTALVALACGGSQSSTTAVLGLAPGSLVLEAGAGADLVDVAFAGEDLVAAGHYTGGLKEADSAPPAGVAIRRAGAPGWTHTLASKPTETLRATALTASETGVFFATLRTPAGRPPLSAIHSLETKTGKPAWTVELESSGYATVADLAASAEGDVFAVGAFSGTLTAGKGSIRAEGVQDGFILCLGRDGALKWAQRFGGAGGDYAAAVAFDSNLGLVVAGAVGGEAAVDEATVESNDDSLDVAVLRLRPQDGAVSWVRLVGGKGTDTPAGIAFSRRSIGVLMTFSDGMVVGGKPMKAAGASDIALVAFTESGSPQWAHSIGSPGADLATDVAGAGDAFAIAGELERPGTVGKTALEAGSFYAEFSQRGALEGESATGAAITSLTSSADASRLGMSLTLRGSAQVRGAKLSGSDNGSGAALAFPVD